ncbi:hypothetical protein BT63DRAFT_224477 [Microthyrium microscopicum]|uniref:Homeobox domain-containing protein n=1 Tax=Microthyrium microscopicum TaxID=703497 RepID=A0A6A6UC92_9PEZI|nr:hypothetical protein BT63DRAFT_224477 [Microthyrium microscopicum]
MSSFSVSPETENTSSANGPSTTPPGKVAFLVHSVNTMTENLPPEVDDKSLARQRRRRTSPEDQKILEEEFDKNPRPDKTARKDIVSRVSLGDKEVQIWFQNRRQNSRRKMRQEGITVPSSDPSDGSDMPSSPQLSASKDSEQPVEEETTIESTEKSESVEKSISTTAGKEETQSGSETSKAPLSSTATVPETILTQPTEVAYSQESIIQLSQQSTTSGYIANRRINSFKAEEEYQSTLSLERTLSSTTSVTTSNPFPSNHDLRLSTTDDGQAKIIDRSIKSPSPEKAKTGSLRRSYSVAGLGSRPPQVQEPARKQPRTLPPGSSRDSRRWENLCDVEAQNSLKKRAELERSGSATEAISLLKAERDRDRVLRQNANKLNSPINSQSQFKGLAKPRQPLRRASTHHGFVSSKSQTRPTKPGNKPDKENWEPSTYRAGNRPPAQGGKKKILGENTTVMSTSSSLGNMMARERTGKGSRNKNNTPPEIHVDEEVSAFMGETRTSTSSGDDLDCVQSLLSLSQGNWA